VTYTHMKYFYGKVTMYPSYQRDARDLVLNFLKYYFPDHQMLMTPHDGLSIPEIKGLELHFPRDANDFASAFKKGQRGLSKLVGEHGESIPPLIKQYMGLSPAMVTFGTFINSDFGKVEETGILIPVDSIYEEKRTRYLTF